MTSHLSVLSVPLSPLLIAALVILGILALYLVPKLQIYRSRSNPEGKGPLELENDYRQTLVQIFGGIAIVATVYAAFENAQLAHQSIELTRQSIELTKKSIDLARQGQMADRTFKALELLSKENNVDAKVAAIYALEQVANEDPGSEWQITETLYNYLLYHSSWTPKSRYRPPGGGDADIRAIGNYLSRRPYQLVDDKCVEQHQCWNYEQQGMPPQEKRLSWDRRIVNIPHLDLRNVFLEGAMLNTANIDHSHMEHSWLRYAHFENAYGQDVCLTSADMRDSHWAFANLTRARFNNAELLRAHLEHVYAEGIDLTGADLHQAVLKNADLNCSIWKGADMTDLDLDGATLLGADLRGARNLSRQQLEKTQGDNFTQLDYESLRPSSWSHQQQQPFKCPKSPVRPDCFLAR